MSAPVLDHMAKAGFLKEDLALLCVVRGRTFLDDLNGLNLTSKDYKCFSAVLRTSGVIVWNENSYQFPSRAARAVWRVVESRSDWPQEKTGGWPYWHFRDVRTDKWEQLQRLRDEFERKQ
jgi:hypothetical protein